MKVEYDIRDKVTKEYIITSILTTTNVNTGKEIIEYVIEDVITGEEQIVLQEDITLEYSAEKAVKSSVLTGIILFILILFVLSTI